MSPRAKDLGRVADFPASGRLLVQADRPVAVLKIGDLFCAIEDLCPHRGGPLSEGEIGQSEPGKAFVTCPWHAATFEIPSGRALSGPAKRDLKTYQVEQKEGRLILWLS